MARVTHVKRAQPLYRMVRVTDESGAVVRTPVMRGGVQRKDKHGRPIFRTQSVRDKTQELPRPTCESCRKPIEVGTAYKHVTPKSGPYGGTTRYRHESCPGWEPWDLSNALWARIAQLQHDGWNSWPDGAEEESELTDWASEQAEAIRELASEKQEAADAMEEGFQHPTEKSQELADTADSLNGWADEVEQITWPDAPERDDDEEDEEWDNRLDQWREEARDAAAGTFDSSPV